MVEEPKFETHVDNDVTVVRLTGAQITEQLYITQLTDELSALLDDRPDLLIDFSKVQFLSSSALGMLTVLLKRVRKIDGRLRLCSIPPSILEVFKITNLDKVFEIYADADEALEG